MSKPIAKTAVLLTLIALLSACGPAANGPTPTTVQEPTPTPSPAALATPVPTATSGAAPPPPTLPAPTAAPATTTTVSDSTVDLLIDEIAGLAAAEQFAGAVLIAKHGEPVYVAAYGLARRSPDVPNQTDTLFNLGSMNKMFTAVAIMQLVEQGRLSLDGRIVDYWPDYPNPEVAGGQLRHALSGHDSNVYRVAFSPDGTLLASASGDRTAKIWDVDSGRLLRSLDADQYKLMYVDFSPDGRLLVSGGDDGLVRLWDVASGQLLDTLHGHQREIYAVAFSPVERLFASAGEGGDVLLWHVSSTPIAIPTESPTPTSTPQAGATQVWEKDNSVMVYVPAGTFWMGSTSAEIEDAVAACVADGGSEIPCRDSYGAEGPRHEVYLDAFWIDRTEVTNAQYRKCVEAGVCEEPTTCDWGTPTYNDDSKADHPVVCVDWNDARTYCQWAGKRLPTEAEWEKAARGTDGLVYPWGDAFDGRLVNFCDVNCEFARKNGDWDDGYAYTAPVGSYADGASPYGAWDMAGNVWEWVGDWYEGNYYAVSPNSNPPGPDEMTFRVARGGSWYGLWTYTRAATRRGHDPSDRGSIFGIRCAAAWSGE